MTKKKSILFIIIALVVGIAVGVGATLGISANSSKNTGTSVDMNTISEYQQKIDAQKQKIDELMAQNDASREQEEKAYKEKVNQILTLRSDIQVLLNEYNSTNTSIQHDDSRMTDIRARCVTYGVNTSIIDNNQYYNGYDLEELMSQVDAAQQQANADFQSFMAEQNAALQELLDEYNTLIEEYSALFDYESEEEPEEELEEVPELFSPESSD